MIDWNSSISELFSSKSNKTADKLAAAGINTLYDLLWTIPLKIQMTPGPQKFSLMKPGELFRGDGKVLAVRTVPSRKGKGKGNIPLCNITLVIQDLLSKITIELKWFNVYPSLKKKLESVDKISFLGEPQLFQGKFQILNPTLLKDMEVLDTFQIQYPTINSVTPSQIKRLFGKIPPRLWEEIPDFLPDMIREKRRFLKIGQSFKIIHGKTLDWSQEKYGQAKARLIYEEFISEQVKIALRKNTLHSQPGIRINITDSDERSIEEIFPFELTKDQKKVINEIKDDLSKPIPMMRMLQGDVSCGKTAVALASALIAIKAKYQVALMCPTESLALQHFMGVTELLSNRDVRISLLIGSTPTPAKKRIYNDLATGEIDLIIGTHSLIQKSIEFKSLGLAIIDEQHKFGVDQRIALVSKTKGSNCLIMTATPIPRSLSLTHYGDLEISTIKELPKGRTGIRTRIVNPSNFEKFLSFLNTRLKMGEQAYIVVPAITESEIQDIVHLEKVLERFKSFFPYYRVHGMHGKLDSEQKESALKKFKANEIDILISTSVIEVGIDVPNATIMAIMNPDRFGLSSLHQLRGRVGRGGKPGFCFLVNDKDISLKSMERLRIIESTTDGFKIAEEDLRLRGEGDLFGKDQSGSASPRKLASIFLHQNILLQAREDLEEMIAANTDYIAQTANYLKKDSRINKTI